MKLTKAPLAERLCREWMNRNLWRVIRFPDHRPQIPPVRMIKQTRAGNARPW